MKMYLFICMIALLGLSSLVSGAALQPQPGRLDAPTVLEARETVNLTKRMQLPGPANDADWYRMKCKGAQLLYMYAGQALVSAECK